jgi:hypothetical protein
MELMINWLPNAKSPPNESFTKQATLFTFLVNTKHVNKIARFPFPFRWIYKSGSRPEVAFPDESQLVDEIVLPE